jgi:hypothetical protein
VLPSSWTGSGSWTPEDVDEPVPVDPVVELIWIREVDW